MAQTPATSTDALASELPDITVSVRQTFGLDSDMQVPAYSQAGEQDRALQHAEVALQGAPEEQRAVVAQLLGQLQSGTGGEP